MKCGEKELLNFVHTFTRFDKLSKVIKKTVNLAVEGGFQNAE
jgi:hypothetical protein